MRVRLRLLLEEGEYKIHKITHFGNFSSKALGAVDCQKYFLDKKRQAKAEKITFACLSAFFELVSAQPDIVRPQWRRAFAEVRILFIRLKL